MMKEEGLKIFSNKSILVTGGTGLIGRQVVDILCDAGAHIKSVSLDRIKINPRAEYIYGDLTDFEFCKEITKEMDFVFHVAGMKGSIEVTKSKPASFFVPLLTMNTNMLEASRINKVQKVVYTSSIGAYAEELGEGNIDAIYFCPHNEDEGCECRKPKPGMFLTAQKKFRINFDSSYIIGDSESDMEAGETLGLKRIFIGRDIDYHGPGKEVISFVSDLPSAAKIIKENVT